MSGGIAYFYDPDDKLVENLNPELVDVEQPRRRRPRLPGGDDRRQHRKETDSPVAAAILADFDAAKAHFRKVMPRDYKRSFWPSRPPSVTARCQRRDHGGGKWLTHGIPQAHRAGTAHPRPVELRLLDWKEVYTEFEDATLQTQASRCMDCGVPFCHNGCPLGNLIPEWNDLVYRGDWDRRHRPPACDQQLPGVHRRLCPAPCEALVRAGHQPRRR